MRTEVAIYLPAGCTPESRRGFWWKQKRTCPATPGWIRCRSTTLAEARTEAPVWLIHQAPQRGAPVLPPAELNFTSTLPPACEMLPEFAALNIESRKSKSRGKWTAVLASTVRGWLFRIMVGGVRGCGHHPVSDHPRNPSPQFHLPKVCDETLADYTFCSRRKDAWNVNPTYYFQIQARLFPTFSQFQTAPLSPVLDGFRVSFDLRQETSRCARPARVLYNSVA